MERSDLGLYQLVVRLSGAHRIRIGRLGTFSFPAGYYIYTGSARRGLESRIARHLRRRKRMRWHVDYLLKHGRVIGVKRYSFGSGLAECGLSNRVGNLPGGRMIVPGFGSSDCKCPTHLFHFRRNPVRSLAQVRSAPKALPADAAAGQSRLASS